MVFSQKMRVLTVVGIAFLLLVFLALGFAYHVMSPWDREGRAREFVVREGWSLKDVSGELERRRIVSSGSLFRLWARVRGVGRQIRAGEYMLGPHQAPAEILNILVRGEVVTHAVTIPEGYTVHQIADTLEREGLTSRESFLSLFRDREFMEAHGIPGPSLEGYLYPDTYHFARGVSSRRIAEAMVRRFRAVVEPLLPQASARGLSIRELVTLASIVEKETGKAEERPLIASVFLNRLRRGMRLESDPCVIYGISDFDGNLTRKHLETPTPYNTYRIHGLPPGPIANPGSAALQAVLFPAESDFLFFVSRNDGSHQFSRTLAEHNRAVRMYQKGHGRAKIP